MDPRLRGKERGEPIAGDEYLWEPVWDFGHHVEPAVPAPLPYDLDDPAFIGELKARFEYGFVLSLPIWDREGQRHRWSELAARMGTEFMPGASYWDAIGAREPESRMRVI